MLVFYHSEKCSFPRSPLHHGQLLLQPNVNPKVIQEVLGTRDLTMQCVLAPKEPYAFGEHLGLNNEIKQLLSTSAMRIKA